jgi:hypothetical protein
MQETQENDTQEPSGPFGSETAIGETRNAVMSPDRATIFVR